MKFDFLINENDCFMVTCGYNLCSVLGRDYGHNQFRKLATVGDTITNKLRTRWNCMLSELSPKYIKYYS